MTGAKRSASACSSARAAAAVDGAKNASEAKSPTSAERARPLTLRVSTRRRPIPAFARCRPQRRWSAPPSAARDAGYGRRMQSKQRSRTAALADRLAAVRARSEELPGAPLVREVLQTERELGGGLIAGGVAFRIFLWLVPFGLVVAAVLSFWGDLDSDGLESAARRFGVGAAAAQAASEALQFGDRNAVLVLVFGLVLLAWFMLGAVRALVLAHALAWQLEPPRIRRPLRVFAVFNGLSPGHPLLGRTSMARSGDRTHRVTRHRGRARGHDRDRALGDVAAATPGDRR